MTGFIPYTYPQPPRVWDPAWAAALIRAIEDAAALRAQLSELRFVSGSEATTGRWIDGRSVLTRVVPITQAFLQTNGTSIAHGITGLGSVARVTGAWNSGGLQRAIPWVASGQSVGVTISATNLTSVVVGSPAWPTFVSGHVIIEYTRA